MEDPVLHPSSEQEGIASEEMRYYHYREFRMQFNKLMNHDHHERRDMKVGNSWDYKEFLYPLDLWRLGGWTIIIEDKQKLTVISKQVFGLLHALLCVLYILYITTTRVSNAVTRPNARVEWMYLYMDI